MGIKVGCMASGVVDDSPTHNPSGLPVGMQADTQDSLLLALNWATDEIRQAPGGGR